MKRDAETYRQMKIDFIRAMAFFDLPDDVQKVAWASALWRVTAASKCYRAIVNSLPRHAQ